MRKRLELLLLFVEIEGKKLSKLVARKWLLQPTSVLTLPFTLGGWAYWVYRSIRWAYVWVKWLKHLSSTRKTKGISQQILLVKTGRNGWCIKATEGLLLSIRVKRGTFSQFHAVVSPGSPQSFVSVVFVPAFRASFSWFHSSPSLKLSLYAKRKMAARKIARARAMGQGSTQGISIKC